MTTSIPTQQKSSLPLGAALIALGFFLLIAQLIDFDLGYYGWPLFIIIPGVLLFPAALGSSGSAGEGLAAFGSVVTATGLLLFYQNAANHFESWAYAWALVAPTSVGLGQIIFGSLKKQPHIVKTGRNLLSIGLVLFLIGAVFFELIIGLSGFRLGGFGWAILLIAAGIIVIFSGITSGRKDSE